MVIQTPEEHGAHPSHLQPHALNKKHATNKGESSCNNATYFWNIKTPTITINEMRSDVIQIRWYSSGGWKTEEQEHILNLLGLYNHVSEVITGAERKAQSCRGHA